jgi:acetylornithine deacetylase/succinyl-diaminopimelate desuccinylase-like protein
MTSVATRGWQEAELLRTLIRNACVNDGTPESGQEIRNATVLRDFMAGTPGFHSTFIEPAPGRTNLVGRWEGDGDGPTLALLAHTDVVPADPNGWDADPFAGVLRDGVVFGRGAVDMLNLAVTMATAIKTLAADGFRPKGTVLFLAVADEEGGGRFGTGYLTTERIDEVRADYVLTEWGGVRHSRVGPPQFAMITGEKGVAWIRARVAGKQAHGSRPYRADNPIVSAGRLIEHLTSSGRTVTVTPEWRRLVTRLDMDDATRTALLTPDLVDSALPGLDPPFDAFAHALTRMTFSPTVINAGIKVNVIPDSVDLQLDVRTLPGQTTEEVLELLQEAATTLGISVTFELFNESVANSSSIETPLWEAMEKAVAKLVPGGTCLPSVTTGGNDARFYRALGAVAYGGGLLSERFALDTFIGAFHGPNERIDLESLALSTEFFRAVIVDLLR